MRRSPWPNDSIRGGEAALCCAMVVVRCVVAASRRCFSRAAAMRSDRLGDLAQRVASLAFERAPGAGWPYRDACAGPELRGRAAAAGRSISCTIQRESLRRRKEGQDRRPNVKTRRTWMFSVRCPSPRRVLLSQQHPFQSTAQRANGESCSFYRYARSLARRGLVR